MEKNPYLSIMIQSLKKKSAVLDAVIELNIRCLLYTSPSPRDRG